MIICNFTDSYKKLEGAGLLSGRLPDPAESKTDTADPGPDTEIRKETFPASCRILDFTDLSGCTGYCSDETADRIRARIKEEPVSDVRYIDDGNHHYLSKLWMEKITEPFDLCVFDHHTDMQAPGLLPYLSCGSWIRDSLTGLSLLQDVYLIGVPEDAVIPEDLPKKRIHVIREEEANCGSLDFPKSSLPLYVSVDLDILSKEEFETIWDQGSMTMKRLYDWIDYLKMHRKIIALDICG